MSHYEFQSPEQSDIPDEPAEILRIGVAFDAGVSAIMAQHTPALEPYQNEYGGVNLELHLYDRSRGELYSFGASWDGEQTRFANWVKLTQATGSRELSAQYYERMFELWGDGVTYRSDQNITDAMRYGEPIRVGFDEVQALFAHVTRLQEAGRLDVVDDAEVGQIVGRGDFGPPAE